MSDNKLLQAILDGQTSIKKEVGDLKEEMKRGFENVNERLDKQGAQLAYLEDDAPTRDEHDDLEKRVGKLENKTASL